ncbi:MAG TPA: DedA family protein [Patescibacteria group bacterium]|nr:DedA family protein [Patescibacteria group bacterium]
MLANLLAAVTLWVVHVISVLGYPGLVLLMALHSMAIPVPSEVVMPFAGFLVSSGRFDFWTAVLAGTLGNLCGASLIYYLSVTGGRRLILRYEHLVLVSAAELDQVEKFFQRFGSFAIFLGRCLPVVATFISIPAGLARVRYWKFAVLTAAGALVWNLLLTFIGLKLGQNWASLRDRLHGAELVIVVLLAAAALWWLWRHLRRRP